MVVRRENKSSSNKAETKSNINKGSKSKSESIIPTKKSRTESWWRQSKYQECFPEKVIELFRQGKFQYEVAADLGINPLTFRKWAEDVEEKPEFVEAVKIGKVLSEIWWVKVARENVENKQFNSVLWMMNMSNAFGWRASTAIQAEVKQADQVIKGEIKHTIKMEEYDSDRAAKIGRILQEAGATESGTQKTTGSQIN